MFLWEKRVRAHTGFKSWSETYIRYIFSKFHLKQLVFYFIYFCFVLKYVPPLDLILFLMGFFVCFNVFWICFLYKKSVIFFLSFVCLWLNFKWILYNIKQMRERKSKDFKQWSRVVRLTTLLRGFFMRCWSIQVKDNNNIYTFINGFV